MGRAVCVKEAYELVELEEYVKNDKGCWFRFIKMPPKQDVSGKPPAKGAKGGATPAEEAKPIVGRAWLSFTDLLEPGATETTQRIYLNTCAPITKKTNEEGSEYTVVETEFE